MAESLTGSDFGWFTPADLQFVFPAIHALGPIGPVILVGGQSLTTWVEHYKIELPPFDGPYLTADADFLGSGKQAELIAESINGTARTPEMGDSTPNTATVVFVGARGDKILIDFLSGIIGVTDKDVKRLAIPVAINDWDPILVLHPLLVLESRCHNLKVLETKRDANGITQARVAYLVVTKYIEDCLTNTSRRKEALRAARRIAALAKSPAGVFVWTTWGIDVMATIDPTVMPGQFSVSWACEIAKTNRKREIASRLIKNRS